MKDFEFPASFGFTGSAGKSMVKGYARGGKAKSDAAQDKKMVKRAVHKHEKAQHPGSPLTPLKKGGEAKVKEESKQKRYRRQESGKGTKAVEMGVEEAKKRLEVIPDTEAQRAMRAAGAISEERENLRLEKNMIESGDAPEYLRKKYGFKKGGMMNKSETGQRKMKGKGYNSDPLVGLKCGGKFKKK